ncbi:MAG TPA: class I SAM-dependent methyltransferase [Negativicutes bacterium]
MSDACFFDSIAEQWDTTRALNKVIISKLVGMIGLTPGGKVLDAGSGTGVLLPFIKEAVGNEGHITAVDFSANMLARAREKYGGSGGITFIVSDIMQFTTDSRFDTVICFNFFPHIKDKHLFFQHMYKLLAAGGILTIMHDISREKVNAIHQGSAAVKDDRLPSGEAVTAWLTAAGYNVVKVIDAADCYFIKAVKL